jgi:hypothetical protein
MSYDLKLSKLVGSDIAEVEGYWSSEFGDGGDAVFAVSKIVFKNGHEVFVDGEHDTAYITPSAIGVKVEGEWDDAAGEYNYTVTDKDKED